MKKLLSLITLMAMALVVQARDLYVVGNATTDWTGDAYHRSPAAMVNVSDNVWIWAGKIKIGTDVRFRITDSGWGGYWAQANNAQLGSEELSMKDNQDEGDYSFTVPEEGYYKVTINTSTLKIKAEKLTEPSKDGDYYLLASVSDYYWFAGYVTSGEQTAKARLTENLDFTTDGFFPLSCDKFKFKGELDGAGHAITGANIIGENANIALVRYATGGAYIRNIVVDGSFEGSAKIGGIIGFARDGGEVKLTNVVNKADVHSNGSTDANAAGLVGCATDGVKITALNCANMGAVSGQNGQCAAFAGWTQSGTTYTNCWNSGAISNIDGTSQLYRNSSSVTATNTYDLTNVGNQGIKVDASILSTGELCYKLNGDQSTIGWYQNLTGTVDAYPVPFSSHAQVYANGELKCDGTSAGGDLTYSNSSTSTIPPHTNEDGWCTVCGTLDQNYLKADQEGYYSLSTATHLKWFAAIVAEVNQSAKARMTADIDYTAHKQGFIGISQGTPFRGEFDGQGHTLTIDIVNAGSARTGLFAYINAATIKNLVVEGNASSANINCVGGLGGRSDGNGTLIENVVVKTNVSYTGTNGDATCGGFFANIEATATLKNCAFYGSINSGSAEGNGAITGWAGGGANIKIINCLVAPTAYTQNGNSADFARNNPTVTNSFKVASDDPKLASGEMAFKLNGNESGVAAWYQLIGTDLLPTPIAKEGALVYANGALQCDGVTPKEGSEITFSNTEGSTIDDHQFNDWGFCSVCDAINHDYMTPFEGVYTITNAKELNWLANYTGKVNPQVDAVITADIDMAEVQGYPGFGTYDKPFSGSLDGQGHKITNLKIDNEAASSAGLISFATAPLTVKGITLDASCQIKGKSATGGFIGSLNGNGAVTLERLGNEASVSTVDQNAGGIVGCNFSGEAKITLTNSYNAGAISSGWEAGGLSGWFGNDAVLTNCYNMGTVANGESFARGNNIQITNCFDPVTNWETLTKVDMVAFTDGTVYDLLATAAGKGIWFLSAEEDGHPVVYNTGIVTAIRENVAAKNAVPSAVYNLNGQRVNSQFSTPNSQLKKGLYIINGRKVVLK